MGACDPERYAPSRNVPLLAVPPNGIRTEPQLALWAAVVGQAKNRVIRVGIRMTYISSASVVSKTKAHHDSQNGLLALIDIGIGL